MSEDHWEAAHAMMLDYRENGENNRAFMAMCEEIAEERESPETAPWNNGPSEPLP